MALSACINSHLAMRALFGAKGFDGRPGVLKRFGRPSINMRKPEAATSALPDYPRNGRLFTELTADFAHERYDNQWPGVFFR